MLLTQVLSLASLSLLIATLLLRQKDELGEACNATADCGDPEVILLDNTLIEVISTLFDISMYIYNEGKPVKVNCLCL